MKSIRSAGPIFVTAWSRSSGRSRPTVAENVLEAAIALIATLNHSRHGAGQRFALLRRRKSSTRGVDYAGR